MKSDIEISNEAKLKPIVGIASSLGINKNDVEQYGKYICKVPLSYIDESKIKSSKLILVTSTTPTKLGIGKTTVTIGLSMGLNKLGYKSVAAIREPSLGPCFGVKGGACGGGYSQVLPMDKINLHFTGDFHAVTSAHNMITALMENYLYQNNIKLKQILWKRVLDMNDRGLREVITGCGSNANGGLNNSGFDITAASEIMAILCLSKNLNDLRNRINNILLGYKDDGSEFLFKELNCTGAIVALLKDALMPNLVQTTEGTPVIVHGGPFANIAHGCSSVIGTKLACSLSDYVITEAGFGSDLGAEKFFNIKCPVLEKYPDLIVVVTTISSLKIQGGCSEDQLCSNECSNVYLHEGFKNLTRHVNNMKDCVANVLVVCNRHANDTDNEIAELEKHCASIGVRFTDTSAFEHGSTGAINLSETVVDMLNNGSTMYYATAVYDTYVRQEMRLLLNKDDYKYVNVPTYTIQKRIEAVATKVYKASDVVFSSNAQQILDKLQENKSYWRYPVCIAKTPYSFTDNPNVLGAPEEFKLTINDIIINRGAGFITAVAGNVVRMPGLPEHPIAEHIDVVDNKIIGLN